MNLLEVSVNIVYACHIVYNIASDFPILYCVRACAHDTGDVIWQYMVLNSKRSVSVHMCVVFVLCSI